MSPSKESLSRLVTRLRQNAHTIHSTLAEKHTFTYTKDRGLFEGESGTESYLSYLPTWGCEDFIDLVSRKTQFSKERLRIFDLGASGKFLEQCLAYWPNKVSVGGLVADQVDADIIQHFVPEANIFAGDIHHLLEYVPENSQDIVSSVQTLRYAVDPFYTLKQIYRVLNLGGVGLIDFLPLRFTDVDQCGRHRSVQERMFIHYLQTQYQMEIKPSVYAVHPSDPFYSVSFQKTQSRLTLPAQYAGKAISKVLEHATHGLINEPYHVMMYAMT